VEEPDDEDEPDDEPDEDEPDDDDDPDDDEESESELESESDSPESDSTGSFFLVAIFVGGSAFAAVGGGGAAFFRIGAAAAFVGDDSISILAFCMRASVCRIISSKVPKSSSILVDAESSCSRVG